MAKTVDPNETTRSSCLDLHCLQRYLYWYVGIKGLKPKLKETAPNHSLLVLEAIATSNKKIYFGAKINKQINR